MKNFNLDIETVKNKIINEEFKKIVIIGKNGVGKTTFINNVKEDLKDNKKDVYWIKTDLNMDKEIKNVKDSTLQNLGALLNDLTNFAYLMHIEEKEKFFKQNDKFKDFCDQSEKSLELIEEWIYKNSKENKIVFENDEDFVPLKIKLPKKTETNYFKITYNKERNMGNLFNELENSGGTGQNFYTLLKLINKILSLISEVKSRNFYLLIDEPEKFCHPELIIKIASLLKEMSQKINIVCISHSNIFINNFIDNLEDIYICLKTKQIKIFF